MDIKDGVTKLAFHYELSANPNADYNFYALVLHERKAEIKLEDGKLLLRAKKGFNINIIIKMTTYIDTGRTLSFWCL